MIQNYIQPQILEYYLYGDSADSLEFTGIDWTLILNFEPHRQGLINHIKDTEICSQEQCAVTQTNWETSTGATGRVFFSL